MNVLALMADDIPYNFVINTSMIKLVLHVMTQALERQFRTISTHFLIDNLACAAANLASEGLVFNLVKFGKQTELFGLSCSFHMVEKAKFNELGMDWTKCPTAKSSFTINERK